MDAAGDHGGIHEDPDPDHAANHQHGGAGAPNHVPQTF